MDDFIPLPVSLGTPSVAVMGTPAVLTKRAKAAIVVRLLINEGADIALEELPPELQAELTHQMGSMRSVDRATVAAVIEEFADAVDAIGLSFPGGMAGALQALDGKIGRDTAARLRKEAGVRANGDPWMRLRALPPEDLLEIVQSESTEVAAVLLSKLEIPVAAGLLGRLSGPQARQITYAVSLTSDITPEAVDRIGLSLAAQIDLKKVPAFETAAADRLGAILNSSSTPTRDDVLTGLQENDEALAEAVRKAIFTFGHIAERIDARDIPRILREVDGGVLITAMAGAEALGFGASRDYILANMSARMADQLREDIAGAGKVKASLVDDAMLTIVTVITNMERLGDLVFFIPDEEDEEEDA